MYVIIQLYRGVLPWERGITEEVKSEEQLKEKLAAIKSRIKPQELCKNCPKEFVKIMEYARAL